MTNKDPDILVRRFVDGELSETDVKEALHRIADDPDARSLLQFELRMTQDLSARSSTAPPRDFADQTMAAVADASASSSASLAETVRAWWDRATAPTTLEIRPVSAIATTVGALLLMTAVFTLGERLWTTPSQVSSSQVATTSQSTTTVQQASASSSQHDDTVWIRFLYTDSAADSVAVAGDFSQWQPIALSPRTVNDKTVWTGLVPVSRGEHEYQFVINGERWVTDPLAPVQRNDGFGARNAVLKL